MRLIAAAILVLALAVLVVGWRATRTVNVQEHAPACTNPFGC